MKKYIVYYIFNEKKYKSTIEANSPLQARQLVKNKIKILEVKEKVDPVFQNLKDILGFK